MTGTKSILAKPVPHLLAQRKQFLVAEDNVAAGTELCWQRHIRPFFSVANSELPSSFKDLRTTLGTNRWRHREARLGANNQQVGIINQQRVSRRNTFLGEQYAVQPYASGGRHINTEVTGPRTGEAKYTSVPRRFTVRAIGDVGRCPIAVAFLEHLLIDWNSVGPINPLDQEPDELFILKVVDMSQLSVSNFSPTRAAMPKATNRSRADRSRRHRPQAASWPETLEQATTSSGMMTP